MVCKDKGKNDVIKLIDLDFAKKKNNDLLKVPENVYARNRLGTQEYMAPELFLTNPYKGELVDVFAIGVTLLFMFVLNHPFRDIKDEYDHYQHLKNGEYDQFWA
jgi:serine/threonine protein kinase